MTRQQILQAPRSHAHGEDRRELHGGARDAAGRGRSRRPPSGVSLTMSDEAIRERTGRGWEEWFDLLDDWGAAERRTREIARWVVEEQGASTAGSSQAVTVSYERARGRARARRARRRLRRHRLEDGRGAGRAPVRGVRRRDAAQALAARRPTLRERTSIEAAVGPLRLGRRHDARRRRLHGQGRRRRAQVRARALAARRTPKRPSA